MGIRRWLSGTLRPDRLETDSVTTDDVNIGGNDLVSSGDWVGIGPSWSDHKNEVSTTSTSYVNADNRYTTQWDNWQPSGSQTAVLSGCRVDISQGDYRVLNNTDDETIHELTGVDTADVEVGPTDYIPTTTDSVIVLKFQFRTADAGTSTDIQNYHLQIGVSV